MVFSTIFLSWNNYMLVQGTPPGSRGRDWVELIQKCECGLWKFLAHPCSPRFYMFVSLGSSPRCHGKRLRSVMDPALRSAGTKIRLMASHTGKTDLRGAPSPYSIGSWGERETRNGDGNNHPSRSWKKQWKKKDFTVCPSLHRRHHHHTRKN